MTTDDHDPVSRRRGYIPSYSMRYRGSQRPEHRFGPGRKAEIQEMLRLMDEVQDPPDFTGRWDDFPRVARARMNLTALSQHYDLYFVAYRGYIYVYRLNRGVKVALGEPEVIIDPKNHETDMSQYVEGYINPTCPPEINHMAVGELGDEEILLVARDNGDVVAWYTQTIAEHIQMNMMQPKERSQRGNGDHAYVSQESFPRHFFADNVGISAWGLAIHKKSRLVAVSSNAHEITVFAFAMNRKGEAASPPPSGSNEDDIDEPTPIDGDAVKTPSSKTEKRDVEALKGAMYILVLGDGWLQVPMYPWDPDTNWTENPGLTKDRRAADLDSVFIPETKAQSQVAKLQRRFQTRQRSWRIVLSLGMEASNVPSISFCEDAEGNANRVAGIDINGYLYVVDIWQIGRKPLRIPPHNVQTPTGRRRTQVRGWNVLPIMDTHLLQTDTLHAAIGLHPKKAVNRAKTSRGTWLDISKCMAEVPNDAATELHKRRIANFRPSDVSGERDGLTVGAPGDGDAALATPLLSSQVLHPVRDPDDGTDFGEGPVRLAMTMVPYSGAHYTAFPTPEALVEFSGPRAAANRAQRVRGAITPAQFRQKAQLWDAEDLLRDVSFLRFNEHDIEMLTLDESDCGTVCHHVLENHNAHNQVAAWDMQFGQRCSMLLRIPELNLVIMGSMCGRVALLTLTKPPQPEETPEPDEAKVPRRAFRVDAVLPFAAEEQCMERPFVCLLGIAVSPVPEARSRGLELSRRRRIREDDERTVEPDPPRRWRLILNYQDHTILQYEIIKREEGEKGSWEDFTGPTAHDEWDFREIKSDEEDIESESDGSSQDSLRTESTTDEDAEEDEEEEQHDIVGALIAGGEWVGHDPDEDFPDLQIV